jgi:hypothetical protein
LTPSIIQVIVRASLFPSFIRLRRACPVRRRGRTGFAWIQIESPIVDPESG